MIAEIEKDLLAHKKRIEENKKYFGNTYDNRYIDYVCVDEKGKIVYPNYVTATFKDIIRNNNLKHIRFHDLRHSCASIMLKNGVQMKQIQEWLGHSNFATTSNTYVHLDYSSKIQSADTIAVALGSRKKQDFTTTADNSSADKILSFNEFGSENCCDDDNYAEYINAPDNEDCM